MADYEDVNDDEFLAAAAALDAEAEGGNEGGGSNATTAEYNSIKHLGLEAKKYKVFRAVGPVPKSHHLVKSLTDAIEINALEIMDDKNRRMKLVLPDRADVEEKNHVMWRILDLVTAFDWVDKKRVPRYEKSHADIFNRIRYGNFPQDQWKYQKGWAGQRVVVMNVIDRADPAWHKEHQHTKLLSKNVAYGTKKDANAIIAQLGVPSYGFLNAWSDIWKAYGNWEKYDVAVLRTGQTNPPLKLVNASAFKAALLPELPKELYEQVVIGPLTDEERAYERYEVARLYGPSNYSKIASRLSGTISMVDAAFGTHFLEEVKSYAEQEKKEWAAKKKEAEGAAAVGGTNTAALAAAAAPAPAAAPAAATVVVGATPNPAILSGSKPATAGRRAAAAAPAVDTSKLLGWGVLSAEQQKLITKVNVMGDKVISIDYAPEAGDTLPCTNCGVQSPSTFLDCPACGAHFELDTN